VTEALNLFKGNLMKYAVALRALLAVTVAAGLAVPAATLAQAYPNKTVRLITPFPPGGTTDLLARIVAQKLSDAWKVQVIVDNRGGGGGTVGLEAAARSAPDGYTIVIAHIGPLSMAPALYSKLPYDTVRDFAPITQIATVPNGLVVHPSLPVKTARDLVAIARSKPQEILYGSAGNGSLAHLAVANFELLAKVQLTHIPYKGGGPAMIDLIAGATSMTITGMPGLMPSVRVNKIRLLGVGESKRLAIMPDVPTIAESGVPGYHVTQWQGILAPANTPRDIIARLHGEIVKAMHRADVKKLLATDGVEPVGNSPEEFGAYIKAEIAHWAPVIKAAGAKVD
jgi:tripartite-type tricarboxylate transporter receptor subunit TctC